MRKSLSTPMLVLILIPTLSLAATRKNRGYPQCGAQLEALSESAQALRLLKKNGVSLTYQTDLYPTQSAATQKVTRYSAVALGQNNVEITFDLEVGYKNLEPNGLRPPIWKLSREARLYWSSHPAGKNQQVLKLKFDDYYYPTQFTAIKRVAQFIGVFSTQDGSQYQVIVRVNEHNLELNGLAKARWTRSGKADVLVRRVKD